MTCQRCHETIREEDRYCPVCGLPQLLYVPAEDALQPLSLESDSDRGVADPAGFAAPGLRGSLQVFAWRPALRAAMILAVPAAVICSGLTPIGLICMAGAAAWAVSLYSKRERTGWLSMGTGARIGLLTGVLASWLTLGMDGVSLWVARFFFAPGFADRLDVD